MLLSIEVPPSSYGHLDLRLMREQQALPPASPCQRELPPAPWEQPVIPAAPITCSFLIAGYAHYNCPLAWVRAGHNIFGPNSTSSPDAPIDLDATAEWKSRNVHAFEFAAELVLSTVRPRPHNPFELDTSIFEHLQLTDQILLSGSLASFLRDGTEPPLLASFSPCLLLSLPPCHSPLPSSSTSALTSLGTHLPASHPPPRRPRPFLQSVTPYLLAPNA